MSRLSEGQERRPALQDCYWRHDGEILAKKDLLEASLYSREVLFVLPRLVRFMNEMIYYPEAHDLVRDDCEFYVSKKIFPVVNGPGNFYIYLSHCNYHVCIYRVKFVPEAQDATSILQELVDYSVEQSSEWIKHCPNAPDRGSPVYV